MKTDPKELSATVAVRIKIAGQEFELTKAEAVKLLDSLQEAVGKKESPVPYVPMPYPVYPEPYQQRPSWEPWQPWITYCGDGTGNIPLVGRSNTLTTHFPLQ